MHEFSMCESILSTALREWRKQEVPRGALRSVRVVIGDLHQVIPDGLQQAWSLLSKDTPAAEAKLVIVARPVIVTCRLCAWQGRITPPLFACGGCGEFSVDVTSGRELFLETLEVSDHEYTAD